MKPLSYMKSFVKDAAKAVKRIAQTEFTIVADNTLTELLSIATLFVTIYASGCVSRSFTLPASP